jgi:Na+/H+-dicarboxylate symporter
LTSLITGVASLSDMKQLTRMGGKTLALYLATTTVAVTMGLVLVNMFQPGHRVPEAMRAELQVTYASEVTGKTELAEITRERGPLQPLVDVVPDNFLDSASSNQNTPGRAIRTARVTPLRSPSTSNIRCSSASRCRASARRRRSTLRRPARAPSA